MNKENESTHEMICRILGITNPVSLRTDKKDKDKEEKEKEVEK